MPGDESAESTIKCKLSLPITACGSHSVVNSNVSINYIAINVFVDVLACVAMFPYACANAACIFFEIIVYENNT
jgi:hypothetical protein